MATNRAERERALQQALNKLSNKTAELNALKREWAEFQTRATTREKLMAQKERKHAVRFAACAQGARRFRIHEP